MFFIIFNAIKAQHYTKRQKICVNILMENQDYRFVLLQDISSENSISNDIIQYVSGSMGWGWAQGGCVFELGVGLRPT